MDTLIRNFKIVGSLDFSAHDLMEFNISRAMGKEKTRARKLNFRRPNFQLIKRPPGKIYSEAQKLNRAGVEGQKIRGNVYVSNTDTLWS